MNVCGVVSMKCTPFCSEISLSLYSTVSVRCGGLLTKGMAFPRVLPQNDHWSDKSSTVNQCVFQCSYFSYYETTY